MKEFILASRYARAFFSLALEEKAAEKYGAELHTLVVLATKVPTFLRALGDEAVPEQKRHDVFHQIIKPFSLSVATVGCVDLLIAKGRVKLLPFIVRVYHQLQEEKEGVTSTEITVAQKEMAEETSNHINAVLKKLLGRKARCTLHVDPKIWGGFIITVGDTVYDASLKGRLQKMKEKLL